MAGIFDSPYVAPLPYGPGPIQGPLQQPGGVPLPYQNRQYPSAYGPASPYVPPIGASQAAAQPVSASSYTPALQVGQAAQRPGSVRAPGAESYAAPILSGMQAGQYANPGADKASAIVQPIASGLAGAASGALAGAAIGAAGGPIGALGGAAIGGGVALVTGGLNSWLGYSAASKEKRRMKALADEIEAREERQRLQNRADALENRSYTRRQYALESQAKVMDDMSQKVLAMLATNQNLRDKWVKMGYV